MPEVHISKCLIMTYTFFLMNIFFIKTSYAESIVLSGSNVSIVYDVLCKDKVQKDGEIVLVLDESLGGWIYGDSISTAELKQIVPLRFEITYPVTRFKKLQPSQMELIPLASGGYHAIIKDYIPEDLRWPGLVRQPDGFISNVSMLL